MMEEKKVSKMLEFEEPQISVIHLTEQDIITTSGDPFEDESRIDPENPIEGDIVF